MAALRWTAFARTDLDNLWFHIAQGSVNAANQYLSGLEVAALRCAANPDIGIRTPKTCRLPPPSPAAERDDGGRTAKADKFCAR